MKLKICSQHEISNLIEEKFRKNTKLVHHNKKHSYQEFLYESGRRSTVLVSFTDFIFTEFDFSF